jgi:hypothetical protein
MARSGVRAHPPKRRPLAPSRRVRVLGSRGLAVPTRPRMFSPPPGPWRPYRRVGVTRTCRSGAISLPTLAWFGRRVLARHLPALISSPESGVHDVADEALGVRHDRHEGDRGVPRRPGGGAGMVAAGSGRIVTISMSEQTMTRRGFVPYGPSGAAVEALSRVMAADLAVTPTPKWAAFRVTGRGCARKFGGAKGVGESAPNRGHDDALATMICGQKNGGGSALPGLVRRRLLAPRSGVRGLSVTGPWGRSVYRRHLCMDVSAAQGSGTSGSLERRRQSSFGAKARRHRSRYLDAPAVALEFVTPDLDFAPLTAVGAEVKNPH